MNSNSANHNFAMQENSFATKQFYNCNFSDLASNYSTNNGLNNSITTTVNSFTQNVNLKPNLLQQPCMNFGASFQQNRNFQTSKEIQANDSIKITNFYSKVKKTFASAQSQQKTGFDSISQLHIEKFQNNIVDNSCTINSNEIHHQNTDPAIKAFNNPANTSFQSVVLTNSKLNIINPAIISQNQFQFYKPLNNNFINQASFIDNSQNNYSFNNTLVNNNNFNFTHNNINNNFKQNKNFSNLSLDNKNNESTKKTHTENLYEFPPCHCSSPRPYEESIDGPFYSQLGVGNSVNNVKRMMLERLKLRDDELRVERVRFTGKDGKNSQGCPIAKWIIRRSSKIERALVLVRLVEHHYCENSVIVVAVCLWDGVSPMHTDPLYDYLKDVLPKQAEVVERKCGTNDKRTCACQGDDDEGGASFSFGCSWSMYYNGCKFARSVNAKKFSLKSKDAAEEKILAHYLQTIATLVAPIFKMVAPVAYQNQTKHEAEASECRLGYKEGRPWSGVTSVMDFCTHAHRDTNNMHHGCTTVLTLTKHRGAEKPEDEQLHVLPSYILDDSNVDKAGVEVLMSFPSVMKIRSTPFVCKNKLRAIKAKERKKLKESFSIGNGNADDIRSVIDNAGRIGRGTGRKRGRGAKSCETNGMRPHSALFNQFNQSNSDYSTNEYLMPGNYKTSNNINNFVSSQFIPVVQKTSNAQYATQCNVISNTNSNSKLCDTSRIPFSFMYNSHQFSSPIDTHANRNENNYNNIRQKINSFNQHGLLQPFKETNLPDSKTQGFFHDEKQIQFQNTPCSQSSQPFSPLPFKSSPILPSFSFFKNHITNTDQFYKNNSINDFENSYYQKSHNSTLPQGIYRFKPNVNNYYKINDAVTHDWMKNESSHISNTSSISSTGQATFHPQNNRPYSLSGKNMYPSFGDFKTAKLTNDNNNSGSNLEHKTSNRQSGEFGVVVSDSLSYNTNSQAFISYNMKSTSNKVNEVVSVHNDEITNAVSFSEASQTKEVYTTNTEAFKDSTIGGVAIALPHGSLMFEVAKRELHATTALKRPNRSHPTRISVVLYQHKSLNKKWHGREEYEKKCLEREEKKKFQQESQQEIMTNFAI